jgi:hypothetical protein
LALGMPWTDLHQVNPWEMLMHHLDAFSQEVQCDHKFRKDSIVALQLILLLISWLPVLSMLQPPTPLLPLTDRILLTFVPIQIQPPTS